MKLLQQILNELGADTLKSLTVIPDFGGYFRDVKGINEFSPTRIVLQIPKRRVIIEGEGLKVGEYFEGDIFIKGAIEVVKIEGAK